MTKPDDIQPGQKDWLRRQFESCDGRSVTISIGVVRGAQPGPTVAHVGGQHGMEHVGPLVLRDFFDELDPAKVSGTVYICPCANPLALELDFEVYPEGEDLAALKDRVKSRADLGRFNMNRVWPSRDPDGLAGRITAWLWQTMIVPAQVVIDHHAVRAVLKPYIFVEEPCIPWTPLLGIEGIWSTGPVPADPGRYEYGRLGMQAIVHGKVGVIIEYSRQHTIAEADRPIGRFACFNLLRALGMYPGEATIRKPVWLIPGTTGKPYWEAENIELKADHAGHPHFLVDEYQEVKAGATIVEIRCLQTHEVLQRVTAPADCLMLYRSADPVTCPGKMICRIHTDYRLLAEPGRPYPVPPIPEPGRTSQ